MTERGWLVLALLVIGACLVLGGLPFIVYGATGP